MKKILYFLIVFLLAIPVNCFAFEKYKDLNNENRVYYSDPDANIGFFCKY